MNDYALKDNASKKRKFLITLIEELEKNGYMKVANPISLYDNLLVGRKKSASVGSEPGTDKGNEPDIDEIETDEQYLSYATLLHFNPNLILYGPPGTGKTYVTQKIIEHFGRKYFKDASNYQRVEEDRVKNITFHQSYSYEEFIEGIRPFLIDDESRKVGFRLDMHIL